MTREIVLAVEVESDAHTVYEAVTTQEGLTAFWTPQVTATPEVGATLRFGFEQAPAELEMTVEALEPGGRVMWSCAGPWPDWTGTDVEWRLDEVEGGTRVLLRHTGWDDGFDDSSLGAVSYSWALVLGALKSFAESGTPQPALR